LCFDGWHVQEYQNVALFLTVLYGIQFLKNFVETLLEVFIGVTANYFGLGLSCSLPFSGIGKR
jgi:hypothetical protein